jgi:hypothetical protein
MILLILFSIKPTILKKHKIGYKNGALLEVSREPSSAPFNSCKYMYTHKIFYINVKWTMNTHQNKVGQAIIFHINGGP